MLLGSCRKRKEGATEKKTHPIRTTCPPPSSANAMLPPSRVRIWIWAGGPHSRPDQLNHNLPWVLYLSTRAHRAHLCSSARRTCFINQPTNKHSAICRAQWRPSTTPTTKASSVRRLPRRTDQTVSKRKKKPFASSRKLTTRAEQLKDILQDFYQVMVQVATYDTTGRPSRQVLANEM